jgi:hypothetical protein
LGEASLEDRRAGSKRPGWNRIPDDVRGEIVDLIKLLKLASIPKACKALASELWAIVATSGDSTKMNLWLHKQRIA